LGKINKQCKGVHELFHLEDHALNINLCIVRLFLFTGIQRVKTGLFCKSNRAS